MNMKKLGLKIVGIIASVSVLTGAIFAANTTIRASKASAHTYILNNDNAPEITNHQGTMTDDKNVTWEYNGVDAYNNGHITINPQGYFGISASTDWGYTGIEGITVNFVDHNTASNEETLWLLKSTDGITWHEAAELVSGFETVAANDWRYIRFYSYEDIIDINEVHIDYACSSTVSAAEDVDLAKFSNVRNNNILEAENTSTVSPNSDGGTALRLFNGQSGDSSYVDISFPKIDSWHDIFTDTIEFDYCHANNQYKPSIQLLNGTKKVGTAQKYDTTKSNYKVTDINSAWWHIEVIVNSSVALYVDHTDTATPNSAVDGIRIISSGNCLIDNLKIGSAPCELGNYNNSSYKPSVGSYLWVKTCWVGKLYSVDIDDSSSLFTYTPTANSPFYIYCDAAGTVDVTVEIECGYSHRIYTITKTIKIN